MSMTTHEFSFAQDNSILDNFDQAKSSSDEAVSLIDSLKGSSLLESMVEGMNFSFPVGNQSNGTLESNILEIPLSDNALDSISPNLTSFNITDTSQEDINMVNFDDQIDNSNLNSSNKNTANMQSIMITPYPMTISSNDYIPLYSSKPSKILEGNILTKLPCNTTSPLLQIVGTSDSNEIHQIPLTILNNFSASRDMCMYQAVIATNNITDVFQNSISNLYLYNPLDYPIEVPTTTSIFIGIHKIMS